MSTAGSETPPRVASAHAGALVLADQCVVSAGNFLAGLLLGRLLLPPEYGAYTLAFATLNALNNVQGALVITPLTIFGASREGPELRSYVGGTVGMQALISPVMALATLATAGLLAWVRPELAPAFLGLAVLIGFDEGQEMVRRVLLARLRFGATLVNDAVYAAVKLGGICALVPLARGSLPHALSAQNALLVAAGAAALATALGFAQIRGLLASPLGNLRRVLRENWDFGRWGLAGAGAILLSTLIGPWLLTALHGSAAVAAFGACQTLVFASNPILNALNNFWGPVAARSFARAGIPALRADTRRYTLISALAMGAFTLVLVAGGGLLLHLVYSGRYDGNTRLLVILAVSTFVHSLSRPLQNSLNAMRRPDLLFATTLLALVLTATLAWPLIHSFGLIGTGVLQLITSCSMFLVRRGLVARAESAAAGRTAGLDP